MIGVRDPAFPPMLAGCEAGMIGYAIFGAAFGQDDLYRFAIVDLGHAYVVNTLSLATVATLVAFVVIGVVSAG